MSEEEIKLTGKQKLFVEKYLGEANFNGTKAAELAGYKGTRASLSQIAYENLRKLEIKQVLDNALSAMTLPANAVLTRLTQIADGKVADFYDESGNFSLQTAKDNGVDHLLKKIKRKSVIKQKKTEIADSMQSYLAEDEINDLETETEIIHEEVEFELYSAHEALRDLGKYHKLFTDRVESDNKNENVNLTPEEWNSREEERIRQANETLEMFDG